MVTISKKLDNTLERCFRGQWLPVTPIFGASHLFTVESTTSARTYLIDNDRKTCTCPDMTHRSEEIFACKHIFAVENFVSLHP